MPKILYVEHSGIVTTVTVPTDTTVMRGAVDNGVTGIIGLCGGECRCATCHVYVDEEWLPLLPEPGKTEEAMLGFTAAARRHNSRLGCQIKITRALDGLKVLLPEIQRRPRRVVTQAD